MRNPAAEMRRALGLAEPGGAIGMVVGVDVAGGTIRVAAAGREIVVAAESRRWRVGESVLIGADGRVIGGAPDSGGVVWVD